MLYDKGDQAGAEALLRRCLEAQERTLGKEHPSTLNTASNLSLCLDKEGKSEEAVALAEEAVAGARVRLPQNHPDRLRYEKNLESLRAKLAARKPTS